MNRKRKKLSYSSRLSNLTQLPFDMTVSAPYIKLCCNREAVIEDAGKLVHYDEECVKVRQRKNTVVLTGNNMKLVFLSNGDLRVVGFIEGISFE